MGDFKDFLNEATYQTAQELLKAIEKEFFQIFPSGRMDASWSNNLGSSCTLRFGMIGDRNDVAHKIIDNDPVHSIHAIYGMDGEGNLGAKLSAETILGKSLSVNPPEGSHLAMSRVKLGWRNKKGTSDQIVKHYSNYFKKMAKVIKENEADIYGRNDIPDKYITSIK